MLRQVVIDETSHAGKYFLALYSCLPIEAIHVATVKRYLIVVGAVPLIDCFLTLAAAAAQQSLHCPKSPSL